ncbi:MAG: sulfotransferase [bacterium]|nr:sulfotransferase [bacterium]
MSALHLFILCPPYSGSTLLWNLVSTSDAVSSLPSEGQFLPEVRDEMRREPWNREVRLSWPRIKAVWDEHWDHDKAVLVEKSPPNLLRAAEIAEHFAPVRFLVMVRDPYAHVEGLMRRNEWELGFAAHFSRECLRQQMANAEQFDCALRLTYEELVLDPGAVTRRIAEFLPELGALDPQQRFKIHAVDGVVERGIVDLNAQKIAKLSSAQLDAITATLRQDDEAMNYWGYEYRAAGGTK